MINIILYDTGDIRNENNEPLGIEVIGARILQEFSSEINIKLLWYNQDGIPLFFDDHIDVIGISLNINRLELFQKVYENLNMLKNKPLIFVGNIVATYGYQYLLQIYKDVICMLGEGEETYVQIINALYDKKFMLEKINNLAFWNGKKICTTPRKTADLKKYVKPIRKFNDFILENKGIARLEGSRGCVWKKCNFCCINYKYNSSAWRPIEVEKIVEQIADMSLAGIKSIYFTDEDFVGNDILHLKELIEKIEWEWNLNKTFSNINYFISIKPIDILDDEVFHLLKRFTHVGLREIFIGIESGCNSQLKRYNKCTTKKINEKVLNKVKDLNVDIDIGYILFDPEVTVEELKENIDFIEKYELYSYGSNFIKRLRIQSYTEFEKKFCAATNLSFDLDNLEYIYNFNDNRIKKIYSLYTNIKFDNYAYQLQNLYRGEVETEEKRAEQKRKIIFLRKIQFCCLKRIFLSVMNDENLYLDDILSKLNCV